MRAARYRSAVCGALLALLPAHAHAQQHKTRTWPLGPGDCEAEMAMRAEMGGIDLSEMARLIDIAFAALSPHIGVMARVDGTVRVPLLMPMSVPIGPAWPTRTVRPWGKCPEDVESFRPFRISLEPGLLLHKHATGFVRASFRSIWHPVDSFFGLGAGFGAIADWQNGAAIGFSSELLLQLGGCCRAPFWQLSLRRDQYPSDRDREAFVVVFGPTVW
jgi:hypothetical protein